MKKERKKYSINFRTKLDSGIFRKMIATGDLFNVLSAHLTAKMQSLLKTRAETAQTMTYSENHLQTRQFQTEKKVADFQESYRLSRQLQTVKTLL